VIQPQKIGIVYLIGAGPGDPQLLTLRGKECIEEADTVIYDYLANDALLQFAKKGGEIIFAGKRKGNMTLPQEEINRLIVKKGKEGKVVARLKGGDPFIFGRGGEEALALAEAGVPFEIIPGVTSGVAVAAYAGIPLTHRDFASTVIFTSGHEDPSKPRPSIPWKALAKEMGTLVFYMGITNLQGIVSNLTKYGCDPKTPIALVRWGTKPEQETIVGTLEDIVQKTESISFPPPVTIVVGEVVGLRKRLKWFENRPLFGKRVLVTRTKDQAKTLIEALRRVGAEAVVFPTIQTLPPENFSALDSAISNINAFDWVVFTSANGVRYFFDRFSAIEKDVRTMAGVKIAAIGEKTALALKQFHLRVDLVPDEAVAEGLVEAFSKIKMDGLRVLIPRAREAREILPDELRQMGARVDVVETYRTIQPEAEATPLMEKFMAGRIDVITFTSASTVKNLIEMVGKDNIFTFVNKVVIASIGPITRQALQRAGLPVHVTAEEPSILGLVDALVKYFERGGRP
jgi:uroporphyrinogen III methyltransferase/synthase